MDNWNPEPFSPEESSRILDDFRRDGFRRIPQVLSPELVTELRAAVDRVFDDPRFDDTHNRYSDFIAVRLFETAPVFEAMLDREPIISLIEQILGPNCHLIAQNVVRNRPGQALDFWHADDLVMFPVAEGMDGHDPRLEMPVFICTVQIPLTDIPAPEYGPTEYVPGSQYAGRQPVADPAVVPEFHGRGPVPVFCQAGDIYLHNGQCWHRGTPNTSEQVRYLFQLSYGMRWVSQRFYPFVNYQLPAGVLERAGERRRRILGFHPKGAYG